MLRIGVFISGNGTNLQAIVEFLKSEPHLGSVACVISDNAQAYGLVRAQKAGIETLVETATSKKHFEQSALTFLEKTKCNFVCLAGFMRVLSPAFTSKWQERIINIHPSLLPAFKGLDTHKRALEQNVLLHGCTVHEVTAKLDDGPILIQAAVPVLQGDDEASLRARVQEMEWQAYPQALLHIHAQKTGQSFSEPRLLLHPLLHHQDAGRPEKG